MSRIGKMPIAAPDNIKVEINGTNIQITGPKGTLTRSFAGNIVLSSEDNQIKVSLINPDNATKFDTAMQGTARSIISNMVKGVTQGFEISLNLTGIGYKASGIEHGINLNYGFSHLVKFFIKEKDRNLVKITAPKPDNIIVSSLDKELAGLYVSKLKAIRKFNIYKGKGISVTGVPIVLKKRKKA